MGQCLQVRNVRGSRPRDGMSEGANKGFTFSSSLFSNPISRAYAKNGSVASLRSSMSVTNWGVRAGSRLGVQTYRDKCNTWKGFKSIQRRKGDFLTKARLKTENDAS